MKVLLLILASDTAPEYLQFQRLWRLYMKSNPNVHCYFYKGHPDLTRPAFLEDDTLWIRINESLETVYEKTLRAFEYFLPVLKDYNYVFRSNLSTVVAFPQMLDYCASLPRTKCCAAVIGGIPRDEEDRNSLSHGFSFPGGNGFLLSPDLVRRLVEEKEPLVVQDDVTIGVALRKWDIPIQEFARPDYMNDATWYLNGTHLLEPKDWNLNPKKLLFSYRLKTDDRSKDVEMMRNLIRRFYTV